MMNAHLYFLKFVLIIMSSITFSLLCGFSGQIAERSAQLHEALLHCGRFQDALESLLSWLTDTEELVANQKPPSAEFKVVKAQIQEQKVSHCLLVRPQPLDMKRYQGK